jgi:acyl carrier protein
MNTTFERLRAILVKDYKLDADLVSLETPREVLGIDSLGLADMLFNLEDEFHILLPPEQVDLPTIGDVVHFIDGLVATQVGRAPQPGMHADTVTAGTLQST